MSTRKPIGTMLVDDGAVQMSERDAAVERQRGGDDRPIGDILVRMGAATEDAIARALARQYKRGYVDPTQIRVDPAIVWRVKRKLAEAKSVLPLDRLTDGTIRVAMADPRDIDTIRDLEFLFHAQVTPVVAAKNLLHRAIQRHYSLEHQAQRMLKDLDPKLRAPTTSPTALELDADAIEARLRKGGTQPYKDLLNFLLVNAIERHASDIHLEPQADSLWVRFRVDGLLREVLSLPQWTERPLATRIKVVGELDFYNQNKPQDGKTTANLGGRKIDLRIACIPSQHGEKIVIRLLDPDMLRTDLGDLGWSTKALGIYYRMVSQPQGLVLCVGPTGSGKSTTLYSSIQRLRSESTSIITVEDPIEYSLPGITQVQINNKAGMTFDGAVRSLLRQDPNVIVIGEIRDRATADAACEAANTGHLVLSTLHTNHGVSTITRLLDLGVPPYLLSSTLTGIVAQRLVRQVCSQCAVAAPPEREDWHRLGIEPIDLGEGHRRLGPGCPACRYVGYRGRTGVYEVLPISDGLRALLSQGANEDALWAQAREDGVVTLLDDALGKVSLGLTTLEEVARVVPVEPWRERKGSSNKASAAAAPVSSEPLIPPDPPPLDAAPSHSADASAAAPQPQAPHSPRADQAPETAGRAGRAIVLVADDAAEIRSLVEATLEDDFDLILAHDGIDALQKARAHKPDLIVLDVMMPGMTGFDVCERLREEAGTGHLPVLFLSARGERNYVKQGFRVGADDYLAKPFDPEELLLRVQALLRRAGFLGDGR